MLKLSVNVLNKIEIGYISLKFYSCFFGVDSG